MSDSAAASKLEHALVVELDAGRRCVRISAEGATLGHVCFRWLGKEARIVLGPGLIACQPQCAGPFQNLAATSL